MVFAPRDPMKCRLPEVRSPDLDAAPSPRVRRSDWKAEKTYCPDAATALISRLKADGRSGKVDPSWDSGGGSRDELFSGVLPLAAKRVRALGIGFLAAAVCVAFVAILGLGGRGRLGEALASPEVAAAPAAGGDEAAAELEMEGEVIDRAQLEREAGERARQYLAAGDWSEVSPYVRGGGQIGPQLKRLQERRPKAAVALRDIGKMVSSTDRSGVPIHLLEVEDQDFRKHRLYFTNTLPPEILWEAHVAYCENPFEAFSSDAPDATPEPGVYRVFAVRDDFYIDSFDDRQRWQSLRIRHPEVQQPVYAYVERGGEAEMLLEGIWGGSGDEAAVILRLAPVEGTVRCLAVVEDVLGVGWHHSLSTGGERSSGPGGDVER